MSQSYYSHHEFASLSVASSAQSVLNVTTNTTLGSTDSGSLIFLGATSGTTLRLPAAGDASGLTFRISVAATAASHSIVAPAASLIGGLTSCVATTGVSLATGAAKTSLTTTAGSAIGDNFQLRSNGTSWFVSGNLASFSGALFA
jgi:hypothetical protein